MGLNWATMKELVLVLAIWPLFSSLQLLKKVGSDRCNNNSYVINVMLMNYTDFPSSTDGVKLAVNQALERVQKEFQMSGKPMGVGYPSLLVISCHTLCHSFLLIWPLARYFSDRFLACPSNVELMERMTSLCINWNALQMGRTIYIFMVFWQTLPACLSGDVQLGLVMWKLLNWIRQDQWSTSCSNWVALASCPDWINLYFLKIIFLLTLSVDHITIWSMKNLQSIFSFI